MNVKPNLFFYTHLGLPVYMGDLYYYISEGVPKIYRILCLSPQDYKKGYRQFNTIQEAIDDLKSIGILPTNIK